MRACCETTQRLIDCLRGAATRLDDRLRWTLQLRRSASRRCLQPRGCGTGAYRCSRLDHVGSVVELSPPQHRRPHCVRHGNRQGEVRYACTSPASTCRKVSSCVDRAVGRRTCPASAGSPYLMLLRGTSPANTDALRRLWLRRGLSIGPRASARRAAPTSSFVSSSCRPPCCGERKPGNHLDEHRPSCPTALGEEC